MDSKTRRRYLSLIKQARTIAETEGLSDHVTVFERMVADTRPVRSDVDPRVLARRLGSFTMSEWQESLGVSLPTARKVLTELAERGIVRDSGLRQKHEGPGRPAPVFEVVPINAPNRPRVKRVPPEVEVRQTFKPRAAGAPVAGSGSGKRVVNSEVRSLVTKARTFGCRIEDKGAHIHVFPPKGGQMVVLPSTPSDHRALLNVRAEMRRAGIPV